MKKIIFIAYFLLSFVGIGQNNALFEQGKEQYKAEKYQEAIANWMKILESGQHSAALYFNIANAHYKLHHIGPSIYYYEKALQLSPNDSEIKNNLSFAQNATVDAIEPLPKTFFAKWDEKLSQWLTFNGWAWVSVIAVFMFAFLFLSYYFSMDSRKKRLFFVGSLLTVLILVTALPMAFRMYHKAATVDNAIVYAEAVEVKNEPKMKAETMFTIHEGTKVKILGKQEDWCRISLADGKDGWIPFNDIKEL
ncbi:MAG: tetratricopeptide repeat protein [Flavobacteriaceae bacterium]